MNGFNNFGKPVTALRLANAAAQLREMLPEASSEARLNILGFVREHVERDTPAALLGADAPSPINVLDLTGRYRVLAAILTGA